MKGKDEKEKKCASTIKSIFTPNQVPESGYAILPCVKFIVARMPMTVELKHR